MHSIAKTLILLGLFALWSCDGGVDVARSIDKSNIVFNELLQESIDGANNNPGTSMTIIAPEHGITWTGSQGYNSLERKDSLNAESPFRIASVTKTFVASTILRMEETGMLQLSDPITKYVDSIYVEILRSDDYQPELITIKHCLENSSGLFNYAQGGKSYLDKVVNDPKNIWDREQQLRHAMEFGAPVGLPGEVYHYSDTGYILLGHIIEELTSEHYGVAMRRLLGFEKLELDNTWLEKLENKPTASAETLRRYYRNEDLSHFDASVDLFGGGGLVSTTADLATYLHALFNGEIYYKSGTLEKMITKVEYGPEYDFAADKKYLDYRMGIYRISIYGMDAYMHSGFWGTAFIHIPELNATIAIDSLNGSSDRLLKKTILYLKNLSEA